MKAIVFTEYGSPDHLQLKEVAKPAPKDDEVLINVHASSVNSWDWEFQRGTFVNRLLFGLLKPKATKRILGADVAGTIEAVGGKVTRFQPGDEVFGDLWDSWGGFAEYACARESALEPKPVNLTFAESAAIPQAGVLALQGLRNAGRIQPGQKVLINGAGGGVGTFAVQLAKLTGTEVTGVDNTHKLDVVRSVGADHVIDYTQEDFTRNGQRYDLILDCQGFRSMFDYKRALSPGGTYAMIGGAIPRMLQALFLGLWGSTTGRRKFRIVAEGPNKGLADLKALIEAGKVAPVIDKTYILRDTPEAFRYFGEGRHKGKVVITMES
ncbi:MAG: NAD(P)-dependent alcohol dehydrogenase [Candidatus Thiodiazotropha sp. (ex Epidulcina cf. delphinae)]|nr:NAD(P)-dependent alcohol dehydrogenase [Candidatus Thiodiazotropha sp. (ex Epidulcina cf. delphinae)]